MTNSSRNFMQKTQCQNFMVISSQFSNFLKFLFFSLFMYKLIWAIENGDDDDDDDYSLTP